MTRPKLFPFLSNGASLFGQLKLFWIFTIAKKIDRPGMKKRSRNRKKAELDFFRLLSFFKFQNFKAPSYICTMGKIWPSKNIWMHWCIKNLFQTKKNNYLFFQKLSKCWPVVNSVNLFLRSSRNARFPPYIKILTWISPPIVKNKYFRGGQFWKFLS